MLYAVCSILYVVCCMLFVVVYRRALRATELRGEFSGWIWVGAAKTAGRESGQIQRSYNFSQGLYRCNVTLILFGVTHVCIFASSISWPVSGVCHNVSAESLSQCFRCTTFLLTTVCPRKEGKFFVFYFNICDTGKRHAPTCLDSTRVLPLV